MAIRLARDFSALGVVARNRANLEQTAQAVRATGAEVLVIDADLAKGEARPGARPPLHSSSVSALMNWCSRRPGG